MHHPVPSTGDGLLNCSPAGAICAMAMAAMGGEGERMGRWPQQGEAAGEEGDVGRSTGGSTFERPWVTGKGAENWRTHRV